jgi:hypothetical protein
MLLRGMSLASATPTPLPNNDRGHDNEVCGQFPASNLEDRVLSTSHNRNVYAFARNVYAFAVSRRIFLLQTHANSKEQA